MEHVSPVAPIPSRPESQSIGTGVRDRPLEVAQVVQPHWGLGEPQSTRPDPFELQRERLVFPVGDGFVEPAGVLEGGPLDGTRPAQEKSPVEDGAGLEVGTWPPRVVDGVVLVGLGRIVGDREQARHAR